MRKNRCHPFLCFSPICTILRAFTCLLLAANNRNGHKTTSNNAPRQHHNDVHKLALELFFQERFARWMWSSHLTSYHGIKQTRDRSTTKKVLYLLIQLEFIYSPPRAEAMQIQLSSLAPPWLAVTMLAPRPLVLPWLVGEEQLLLLLSSWIPLGFLMASNDTLIEVDDRL